MDKNEVLQELNQMVELFQIEEPKKADFHPHLKKLDEAFLEDFKDVVEPPDRIFFRYDEDERLRNVEKKEALLQSHPECCLLEAVKFCQDKMYRFLKKYNIGFLKDFYLNENGKFFVSISCMITNMDSFHQETATKEIKEQFQMDLLTERGIEIYYNTHFNHNEISATTESVDAVIKLLKEELNARILEMKLREFKGFRNLDKISFYVDSDLLFEKNWNPIEIILETKEETLNANETGQFYHAMKELSYALSYLEFNQEVSVSLIKSLFTELCELVNYKGKIFQEAEEKRRPIREKNALIHKKETELGAMMKDVVKKSIEELSNRMKREMFETLNFNMREIKATPYQIQAEFYFSTGPNFDRFKQLTDEELYQLYDTNHGTLDAEDILVLCTERNQDTLYAKVTEKFPNAVITDLEVKNHWSIRQNAIKGFTVSLDKI